MVISSKFKLLLFTACILPAGAAEPADPFAAIRENIRQAVQAPNAPSIAVAVAKDGKIVWEEGFGFADREKRTPATAHTLYPISSVTKMFTATGLMTLVKAGKVDLDKPVNDYLGDAKISAPAGDPRKATVRLVANHLAGLPIYYEFFYADAPYKPRPMDETIRRYGVLMWPPGERVRYSNLGYGILGEVIARVSGDSYRDFMKSQVFERLGLHETVVDGADPRIAVSYGSDQRPLPRFEVDPEAAMGIYSSAHDLARLAMFLGKMPASDQQSILSGGQIDEMQKPAGMISARSGWGIGCGIAESFNGYRIVSHNGKMQGAASTLRVIPAEKTAIVVLSNYDYNLPHAVADALMRVLLPKWNGMLADLQLKNLDSMEPLRGNWTGSIHTEDRDLPFRMRIENAGEIHVQISNNLRALLNVESWLDGNLKGEMYGDVGTEDAARRRYTIALDLDLHHDVLRGSATALSVPTQRNGSALPYYVELRRAQDQRPSAGTRQ